MGRRWLADVTPLREHPAYRRLWAGQGLSFVGSQMTAVAVPVQVYRVTGSTLAVGLLGLVTVIPLISVGLLGGSLADSMDRRRLVLVTSVLLAATSSLLAVQSAAGNHRVWPLYVLAGVQAAIGAVDSPARSTFVARLVPSEQIPAATALSVWSVNVGMMAGPLLAGTVIALFSVTWAYVVDSASFGFALWAVLRLPEMHPEGGGSQAGLRSVGEGLRWVLGHPVVLMSFAVDIVAMVFGMPRTLFPALSRHLGGDTALGLLYAAPAIGAVIGLVFSGPLGRVHRHGLAVLVSVCVWGAAIAGFGVAGSLWMGVAFLAVAGAADAVSAVFRSTILQSAVPDEMRGRLYGVFFVVVAGGPRIGDVESGVAAAIGGVRFSAWSGGLACLVVTVTLGVLVPSFARYRARSGELTADVTALEPSAVEPVP